MPRSAVVPDVMETEPATVVDAEADAPAAEPVADADAARKAKEAADAAAVAANKRQELHDAVANFVFSQTEIGQEWAAGGGFGTDKLWKFLSEHTLEPTPDCTLQFFVPLLDSVYTKLLDLRSFMSIAMRQDKNGSVLSLIKLAAELAAEARNATTCLLDQIAFPDSADVSAEELEKLKDKKLVVAVDFLEKTRPFHMSIADGSGSQLQTGGEYERSVVQEIVNALEKDKMRHHLAGTFKFRMNQLEESTGALKQALKQINKDRDGQPFDLLLPEIVDKHLAPLLDFPALCALRCLKKEFGIKVKRAENGARGGGDVCLAEQLEKRLPKMRVRFTPGALEGIKFDGTPQGYEGASGLEHKGAWPHYRGVLPGYFNDEVVNVVTADGQVELFVEFATFEARRTPLLVGLKVEESPDLGAVAALAEYDNPYSRNVARIRTHFFDRFAAEPVLPPDQELPEVAQKLQECVDRARSAVLALGEKEAELHNLMTEHRRKKTMVPQQQVARLKAEHKALIKPVIDAYAAKDWPVGRLPADSIHYYGPNAPLTAEGFRKSEIDGRDRSDEFPRHSLLQTPGYDRERAQFLRAAIGSDHHTDALEALDLTHVKRVVDVKRFFPNGLDCSVALVDAADQTTVIETRTPKGKKGEPPTEQPAMLFGKGGNKHFHGPDEPAGYDKWEVKDEDKDRKDIVRPPVGTFALRKRFRVKATSFLDGKRAVECKTKEKPFKLRVRASGERSDGQYCEFECFSDPFYVVADRESLYRMVKRGKNKAAAAAAAEEDTPMADAGGSA